MRTLLARLRVSRVDPVMLDWLLAGALVVVAWLETLRTGIADRQDLIVASATSVIAALVAVRRRYPSIAGLAAGLTGAALATTIGPPSTVSFGVAWICAMYALAVWSQARDFVICLATIVVATVVAAVGTATLSSATFFALITAVVMILVHRIVVDRDRRAQLAERERDVAAREAVIEERARIARELHDVIAHHVSMIVVQAGAERRLLDDGSGTREVLVTIEDIGRNALTEMRRLVGILRGDAKESLAPQPGMAQVPQLVAQVREAGVLVDLDVVGERMDLPMGIDLTAYRIVQEGLTNALKHSDGTPASVGVRYAADNLDLTITSSAPATAAGGRGGGHGLVGMRERAVLYGGSFDAGVDGHGAFVVHVRLPTA